jgi:hypothetical protein
LTVTIIAGVIAAAAVLLVTGCALERETDAAAIRTVLNGSGYTDESNEQAYGSSDSTVQPGGDGPFADDPHRVPFIRFRRYIPRGGVSRTIEVEIEDTTAVATITAEITGELRTMFDTTTNPIFVWRKPIHDRAVRTVFLARRDGRWRIRKVSPLAFSTIGAPYDLRIVEFKAHASSWPAGDTFRITSADTMLSKDQLPTFVPLDTVTTWVTLESTGDSAWTFLHHGRPAWPHRWRRAYLKAATHQFQGTWLIGDEGYDQPQVRPSGHDAIGWQSLWGDSSQPYVSTAWGLPYIVKEPQEEIPEE